MKPVGIDEVRGSCVSCEINGGSRVQGVQVPCQGSGGEWEKSHYH